MKTILVNVVLRIRVANRPYIFEESVKKKEARNPALTLLLQLLYFTIT